MAYLEVNNVCKTYHMGEIDVEAVKNMSFIVNNGEFVVVVGPSGSGKTTLLNMIGGMDTISSGSIILDNVNISNLTQKELTYYRRYDIGFVFQFYNLIQNLSALENVELASQICKDPLDAKETLEAVGLGHRIQNFPGQLSGGEQQRVAIARALAKNPKILLCDEPTGALDYKTGKAILKLLQQTCYASGKCVMVITHNSAFESIADRVIHIREGHVSKVCVNEHPLDADILEW